MSEPEYSLPEHSPSYGQYFARINDEINIIYEIARRARLTGFDPVTRVEIPPAHDVAARVEATLEGPIGVAKRIRELEKTMTREEVAFVVAKEIAEGSLGRIYDPEGDADDAEREKAADKAVRVALAILTESITAAPLEGIAKVRIRGSKRESGDDRYLALYLAGPIRAAGGTEAAMTVLVADHVRQVLGLPRLKSTESEVERALEEVELYARNVHLQYPVNPELIKLAAGNLPIMLTGEPTEEIEVSGSRDLERIETNRVRGGAVLVLSDGVVGRAAKLAKIVNRLKIPGWDWLDDLAARVSKARMAKAEDSADRTLAPKSDYLADIIGGRPVFSHPSRLGGFRLRYGRSRNTGLAAVGIHPATMFVVDEFLAAGTHIRTERPGKGAIVAPVDTIEGPIVRLKDGSVIRVDDAGEAQKLVAKKEIDRILYLGDILVAFGEFLENNHPLVPVGYCEERWSHDVETASSSLPASKLEKLLDSGNMSPERFEQLIHAPLHDPPSPEEAIYLSRHFQVPLHPRFIYRWAALSAAEAIRLRNWMLSEHTIEGAEGGKLMLLPNVPEYKTMLEKIGLPHRYAGSTERIQLLDSPLTIVAQLGSRHKKAEGSGPIEVLNSVSDVRIRDKTGLSVGARMGRPEKAEERKMKPPIQALFPVGRAGAAERKLEKLASAREPVSTLEEFVDDERLLSSSSASKRATVEVVSRICHECSEMTYESRCPKCGAHTEIQRYCSAEGCGRPVEPDSGMCPSSHDMNLIRAAKTVNIDIRALLERVKSEIHETQTYDVRGVLGLTNELKIPEYLGKGILRAKHEVYCYRDGTARFDATDAPLTHFTPNEVDVSLEQLHEMGYTTDNDGEPIISKDQVVELKVQDLVVSESCAAYLVRVGKFVDDELERIYGLPRYYNFNKVEDVIGQLVVGLAPHTSAGIIGRIIGFTDANVCFAHPYWHAAKRRNCDGDEDSLMLVLDALLNFSKSYLPAGRGGFMDAPLVLSVILNPREVDDESHNMEVCSRYPAKFYEMTDRMVGPKTVENLVDIVEDRLGKPSQYEGFKFTHGTMSIHSGPRASRYKTLGSMNEKLHAQLRLATQISAVDAQDVAERVLSHHFIRDIRGNMRAFSTQRVQCLKCRRTYRRVPLSGRCICGSSLALTVRKKNISKYLGIAEEIIDDYGLGPYIRERLHLITSALDSMFTSDQTSLTDFVEDN